MGQPTKVPNIPRDVVVEWNGFGWDVVIQPHHRSVTCGTCDGRHLTNDGRLCNDPKCGGTGFKLVNMNPEPTDDGLDSLVDDALA